MTIRLLLPVLLMPVFSFAQFLPSETPLQQAYIQATQEEKLIFLMIESDECQQCNDVADKAFQNDDLQHYVKENFVALRISPFHPDLDYIRDKYNYQSGNNVLFLDKWGTLVHRLKMSTTQYSRYITESRIALSNKAEADQIRTLEQDALAGKMETDRLYELIIKRRGLSLPIDALLDQYVYQLSPDSLKSISTVTRLVRMSPVLGSIADIAMHKNRKVFERVWDGFTPHERLALNRMTIFRTRQQAVEEKNYTKAVMAAEFARNSSTTDKEAGDKVYNYNMMEFYRGVKDTAAYLTIAVEYYDKFQMSINADEIKMQDSVKMAAITKQQFPRAKRDTTGIPANARRVTTTVRYRSVANYYSQLLNNGARSVYMMTNNPVYLKKALQWSAYSNKLFETPYVLDTWARLLYKADKNVNQAIQLEEKAIAILKEQGYSTNKHDETLNKIKKGTLD